MSHAGGIGGSHAHTMVGSASGAIYFYHVWYVFAACVIVMMVSTIMTIMQQAFQKTRP